MTENIIEKLKDIRGDILSAYQELFQNNTVKAYVIINPLWDSLNDIIVELERNESKTS